MGKGLIPADLDTWRVRRRAIVPAFHKAYYEAMVDMFMRCSQRSCAKLQEAIAASADGRWAGKACSYLLCLGCGCCFWDGQMFSFLVASCAELQDALAASAGGRWVASGG
jgi:hypothetical protein